MKKPLALSLLVVFGLFASLVHADEPAPTPPIPVQPIRLPVVTDQQPQPPQPSPSPRLVTTLPEDYFYVVESDVSLRVIHSPDGFLNVSAEEGPITLRGKFAGSTGKVETKKFSSTYVYVVEASKAGLTELILISDDDIVRANLSVAGAQPPPDPKPPDPKPPEPEPEPKPEPVKSFRVIFVKESGSTLSAEQTAIPGAKVIRDYLNAKTTVENGVSGWREYDPDQSTTNEQPIMKALWAAVKPKIQNVPCLVIEVNGSANIMPFPTNTEDAMKTLKKYGGE